MAFRRRNRRSFRRGGLRRRSVRGRRRGRSRRRGGMRTPRPGKIGYRL